MDSPRGRIYLMEGLVNGTIAAVGDDRRALRPLPRLHGLRDVVPVGRPVRTLIEQTRAHIEQNYRRPVGERLLRALIFPTVPHPRRLRPPSR